MIVLRRILTVLSILVVAWIATSIGGLVLDPGRVALWSTSLVGAFLASLLIVPALVMLYDETLVSSSSAQNEPAEQQSFTDAEAASMPEKEKGNQ